MLNLHTEVVVCNPVQLCIRQKLVEFFFYSLASILINVYQVVYAIAYHTLQPSQELTP